MTGKKGECCFIWKVHLQTGAPNAKALQVAAMLRRVLPVPGQLSESADSQSQKHHPTPLTNQSPTQSIVHRMVLYTPFYSYGMPCYFHSGGRPSRPAATEPPYLLHMGKASTCRGRGV